MGAYTIRQVLDWYQANPYMQYYHRLQTEPRRPHQREITMRIDYGNGRIDVRRVPWAGNVAFGRVETELKQRWPACAESIYNFPLRIELGQAVGEVATFSLTLYSRFIFGGGAYFTAHPTNDVAKALLKACGLRKAWEHGHIACPESMVYSADGLRAYIRTRLVQMLLPDGQHRARQLYLGLNRLAYKKWLRTEFSAVLLPPCNADHADEAKALNRVLHRLRTRCNITVPDGTFTPIKRLLPLLRLGWQEQETEAWPYPNLWEVLEDFDGDIDELENEAMALLMPGPQIVYY